MNLDNQKAYWNSVANIKTFTHPLDLDILDTYLGLEAEIVDFGCGYGRLVKELSNLGYTNIVGFDTSRELVNRGMKECNLPLFYIGNPKDLPVKDNSVDCILLFAVLTSIPSNIGQKEVINLLKAKLKPGGILYISDYYLQENTSEVREYQYFNDDKDNFGVFTLSEGATFRHHAKEWISELLKEFTILEEKIVEVKTMNGHSAEAFQIIARK